MNCHCPERAAVNSRGATPTERGAFDKPTLKGSHAEHAAELGIAQTLVNLLAHLVFSTRHRAEAITPEIEPELYAYLGGIARQQQSRLLAAGGTAHPAHLLLSQSKNLALSALLLELKKSPSKWIKTRGVEFAEFQWQDGYGAFTIGASQIPAVKAYLARQKEHHRKKSFQEELIEFLEKYGLEYDERYWWD
jgi:putative transposase